MFGLRAPLREFNIPLTPFKGIAVKLSIVLLQERIEEVSPPFEGGVDAAHR